MEWKKTSFDWTRARAFLATAETGSLSAAARVLGLAQPTLGRQVAALEEELGVTLFDRSGRGLSLTPTGLDLVEHVREMAEAATRVSRIAAGQAQEIAGPICITASEVTCTHRLPPVVSRLRAEQPGIEIEIVATNEMRDLRQREADIAIRNARPADPDLVARRLGDDTGSFYASTDYLDRLGNPADPEGFAEAEFIGFQRNGEYLGLLKGLGFPVSLENFRVISANHHVHWAMVKAGVGIGAFPTAMGDAEPGLRRILPGLAPIDIPVWLVAHRDLRTSRRMRLVFDLLAEALGTPG